MMIRCGTSVEPKSRFLPHPLVELQAGAAHCRNYSYERTMSKGSAGR